MEKNENKKVIAYIDAANIILSCERLGIDLDFLKLQVYLKHKFRADEIYYFTANLKELVLLSGDGDFSMLLDYANENSIKVNLMPADKKSSSKILRIKSFLKIIFLEEIKSLITKEKTPAGT